VERRLARASIGRRRPSDRTPFQSAVALALLTDRRRCHCGLAGIWTEFLFDFPSRIISDTRGAAMANAVLRLPELIRRTGLSRSSIYNRIVEGAFPRAFSLGGRSRGWLESEVDAWIKARAESRELQPRAGHPGRQL
jgi:prophage regulatory protein